ncbi:hypothetical protein J6590_002764 [Homalodisca vitripennis]|nr:hypothetical protein J6590_002764 [Homalodisca vitripennis]
MLTITDKQMIQSLELEELRSATFRASHQRPPRINELTRINRLIGRGRPAPPPGSSLKNSDTAAARLKVGEGSDSWPKPTNRPGMGSDRRRCVPFLRASGLRPQARVEEPLDRYHADCLTAHNRLGMATHKHGTGPFITGTPQTD